MDLTSLSKPEAVHEAEAVRRPSSRRHDGHHDPEGAGRSRTADVFTVSGRGEIIAPIMETVIGVDERERVPDTENDPWRMVCALRMRGPGGTGAIGTGWFIGPRTVITAGHCVFSRTFFGGWAERVEVIPGLNRRRNGSSIKPFGSAYATRMSVLDAWESSDDRAPDFEVGCIHLDEPLGESTGWFGFAALTPDELEAYRVNISGYPADRGGGDEQYFAHDRILRVGERRVSYDVDTHGGQSGAPVWIQEEGRPPLAVAIHAYGIGDAVVAGDPGQLRPPHRPRDLRHLEGWLAADGAAARTSA